VQGSYVEADRIRTYYIERGRGPVLVLLHGGALGVTCESAYFRQIEELAADFRVIAFDQVCFGRTDMPQDGVYRNRLQRVDHTLAFLKALGVARAAVAGHSEGGFMAARMAITHPDLVSHLVIMSSGATAPLLGGDADKPWVEASKAAYRYQGRVLTEDEFIAAKRAGYRVFDARLEAILRENYRRALGTGEARIFQSLPLAETDPLLYMQLQTAHIAPHLGKIKCPTLLIWSTEDTTVTVARGVRLREMLPRADLHLLADAGHPVMHDRADAVNALLRSFAGSSR
jgi:pimeloyl-ACP methyl ester carboxylesterase